MSDRNLTLDDERRGEAAQRAAHLRELASATDDPEERDRLLGAAAETEGMSLNGAGFARPSGA